MRANAMLDCVIAGEANVDLLIEGTTELEINKEKLAKRMDLVLGGSSSITAFNLASLGTKVGFVGVVGKDSFGRFVEERLAAAGVHLEALRRQSGEKTGLTIWHSRKRARAGVTYPGTIAMLRPGDITEDYLKQARHLHVGHYFLLEKFHKGAPALFRKAKRLGLTTSIDCNYDPAERWNSGIRDVLRYTDIFFPNEAEARCLTGCRSIEDAACELGKLAGIVAIKLGARGALVYSGGTSFRVPAVKTKVVDTTGAGDSFNAGFLSRFLRGAGLRECARAGVAAGALCITRVGGTAAFEKKR